MANLTQRDNSTHTKTDIVDAAENKDPENMLMEEGFTRLLN